MLTQQVHTFEAKLSQSILDTLAREEKFDHQLQAMEKRVPTSSEASAVKQKGGKVQVTAAESTSLETRREETNTEGDAGTAQLEKAMLERLSAVRSELQQHVTQQGKDLQQIMDANRLKSDSEIEVLKNGLAEQVFQLQSPLHPL